MTLVPDPPQPEQTHLYRQMSADQNRQFTFKNLLPGTYRVYAWETLDNGAHFDPRFSSCTAVVARGLTDARAHIAPLPSRRRT